MVDCSFPREPGSPWANLELSAFSELPDQIEDLLVIKYVPRSSRRALIPFKLFGPS